MRLQLSSPHRLTLSHYFFLQKLTMYIPGAGGSSWSTQVFADLKAHPYNRQRAHHHASNGRLPKQAESNLEELPSPVPPSPLSVQLTEA